MSILDKLTVEDRHYQRPWDFNARPSVSVDCQQVDPDAIGNIVTAFEFDLTAKVGVRFACNKAQYQDAKRNAEKLLLLRLYGDFLPHLHEAIAAIYAGDAKAALTACAAMEKEIGI